MRGYLVFYFAVVLCASCGSLANDDDSTAANDDDSTAADDDDSNHWWNSAPALGTDGAWCVAYRTP